MSGRSSAAGRANSTLRIEIATDTPLAAERRVLERPDVFGTEQPNPDHMGYTQLRAYTEKLRVGGFDVTAQDVALGDKPRSRSFR